jgi:hypothetical protein
MRHAAGLLGAMHAHCCLQYSYLEPTVLMPLLAVIKLKFLPSQDSSRESSRGWTPKKIGLLKHACREGMLPKQARGWRACTCARRPLPPRRWSSASLRPKCSPTLRG